MSKSVSKNVSEAMPEALDLLKTPFYQFHINNNAKMVPFAGYDLPVHYEMGIKQEHLHTRSDVGLFDVSHMGQAELVAKDYKTSAHALEAIVPSDVLGLKPQHMRYSVLLNGSGGIEDDMMITHRINGDGRSVVGLVVNGARKSHDYDLIAAHLPKDVELKILEDRALLALQGPEAEKVIAIWCGQAVGMPYMSEIETRFFDVPCRISRCGYTGEDGFEISMKQDDASRVMKMLLSYPEVRLIGLGARDSLRLEAGFCLYGHDIDDTISPIEADLAWIINKRRRADGGFLGEERILSELTAGPPQKRVGLLPLGTGAPAREGAQLFDEAGTLIGHITSGAFGPSINTPIAMGYVALNFSKLGTIVQVEVRGKRAPWQVVDLPFVPYKTYKTKQPTRH